MAPVKRAASTAQRETRATRGSAVVKKRNATTEKDAVSPIAKASPKATATSKTSTRRSKRIADEEPVEVAGIDVEDSVLAQASRNRSSKNTATKSDSIKAPTTTTALKTSTRRRIKVTPLDAPVEQVPKTEPKKTRAKSTTVSSTKKPNTRTKESVSKSDEVESEHEETILEDSHTIAPRTRSTRKAVAKGKTTGAADPVAPKTRGRPKKISDEQVAEDITNEKATAPVTRSTRSNTSASIVLEQIMDVVSNGEIKVSKPSKTQKKVTFQVLPEDDKENQPLLATKSKKTTKTTGKVSKASTAPGGLRARPLRKAVTPATSARTKKGAASDRPQPANEISQETQEKKMPRALTPKKIMQVAKSVPATEGDEGFDSSDGEDELNGGKTPVRDLAISPKRPPVLTVGHAMSPIKRLDFSQNLAQTSPNKVVLQQRLEDDAVMGSLASPARRLPASPFKDSLKDSPKRGMGEKTRLLFPVEQQGKVNSSVSVALNPSNVSTASQSMSTLLQSPRRTGVVDASVFSQSAMKPAQGTTSLKSSLLGSPAKRLFSPNKKTSTLPSAAKISGFTLRDQDDIDLHEIETETTASSHFRATASPTRVHRLELGDASLDFDDSVLQVGSPLKLRKSPIKSKSTSETVDQNVTMAASTSSLNAQAEASEYGVVAASSKLVIDPSELSKPQEAEDREQHIDEQLLHCREPAHSFDHNDAISSRQSFSQILFRAASPHSEHESSEDELASEATPARPLPRQRSSLGGKLLRQSTGLPTNADGQTFGFTPLAAQMSGWLASSPQKTPKPRPNIVQRAESFEFSPLASQHIDGVVTISRDATPVQSAASKRSSLVGSSRGKRLTGLRKSIATQQPSRSSLGRDEIVTSHVPVTHHFDEFMEMRAIDENLEAKEDEPISLAESCQDFDQIMNVGDQGEVLGADDTITLHDFDTCEIITGEQHDLTTDLVNSTHASHTAMIDFQELAEEADALAPTQDIAQHDMDNLGSDNEALNDDSLHQDEEYHVAKAVAQDFMQSPARQQASSPIIGPIDPATGSPSILVIDQDSSPNHSPSDDVSRLMAQAPHATPVRPTPRINRSRIVNTVVSKIPLKPEGQISPIKMERKRAQSFGDAEASPPKRLSLGSLKRLAAATDNDSDRLPVRISRTQGAPSPGGTSTPVSRCNRLSLGGCSAATTPGQKTFTVDDFGNSTLDGIEIPDDYEQDESVFETVDYSPSAYSVASGFSTIAHTPRASLAKTPATSKSIRRATTPAALQKTPMTTQKSVARKSANSIARTPLKPVSNGVLSGAVVFVDVYTSEGADASSIFVDLLTQMGAKCVKDWRWNPRASLAPGVTGDDVEQRVGITHVVYKDGGKRTLEKVRSTKGEVCCVGVAWVLDCERQSKWLDESSYVVDTTLLPRGGSRRRKSMEPRALLVQGDGSVSAGRPRRSVSAEMSELMKRELVNTPGRSHEEEDDDEDLENQDSATPTGYVAYDPRTAMTPGTPYLISQGKKLIQMTAPPKQQTGRRLFEDENDENDDTFMVDNEPLRLDAGKSVRDAQKFRMKNLSASVKNRRKTLGFKPIIGSPLSRI